MDFQLSAGVSLVPQKKQMHVVLRVQESVFVMTSGLLLRPSETGCIKRTSLRAQEKTSTTRYYIAFISQNNSGSNVIDNFLGPTNRYCTRYIIVK